MMRTLQKTTGPAPGNHPARGSGFPPSAIVQPRLTVNEPGDAFEREADAVADRVMRMDRQEEAQPRRPPPDVQRLCAACEEEQAQRKEEVGGAPVGAPSLVAGAIGSGGRALDERTRSGMEGRLGRDFSQVRVHDDAAAAGAARSIQAQAFTSGNHIVFGAGRYAPGTPSGKRLLAHELTHVVQQRGHDPDAVQRDMYDPQDRAAMRGGTVTATAADRQIAASCGFQPGDIVFRLGSAELARRIGEPVTHGGIYLGDGLIHDMVGFGNRTVPLVEFYAEAADPGVIRMVRFVGPLQPLILARLLANLRSRDLDLPTDPVPWNLFSAATDYRTATCLEYSHAQFLHAIRRLDQDTSLAPEVRAQLRQTYFAGGGDRPQPLIAPRTLRGGWPAGRMVERWLLVAAADFLAEDVDPSQFSNRWEGAADESIQAFTYGSFVDARQFFQPLECGQGAGSAPTRYRQQVLPIRPPTRTNVTDPVDRTVTRQTGIAWAQHASGTAYMVLIAITNSTTRSPTQIVFLDFVDEDLRSRAATRALRHQPRGIQTLPWSAIPGIPSSAPATAARRPPP